MIRRSRLLIIVVAASFPALSAGLVPALAETLTLKFLRHDDRVSVTVSNVKSAPVLRVSEAQVARLRSIFMTLECRVNPLCHWLLPSGLEMPPLLSPNDLKQAMAASGDKLFGPFRSHLKAARHIVFEIDWSMLKWPLDLLHFDGQPLFLSKEVSYRVDRNRLALQAAVSSSWKGLLISDATADPQRAIFTIADYFSGADKFDVNDVSRDRLSSIPSIDFLAISAHGSINAGASDYIMLHGEEWVWPQDLARLRPKLVYFDSCSLGISAEFLRSLKQAGTKAVLAPILSNEAGNSSTETIAVVFREISSGNSLPSALFAARTRLYDKYRHDDFAKRLWRAYPFRLYDFS